MKTKPKPRVMWANPIDLAGESYVSLTKTSDLSEDRMTNLRVAVIPLDDVEALVERAAKALFTHELPFEDWKHNEARWEAYRANARTLETELAATRQDLAIAKHEAAIWKSNHDNQVKLKSIIMSRPDLGDRAPRVVALMDELARLRAELADAKQEAATNGHLSNMAKDTISSLRAENERLTERLNDVANSHARELHRADGAEDRVEAQLAALHPKAGTPPGSQLRSERLAAKVQLSLLARALRFSEIYLANVEAGLHVATPELQARYRAALKTARHVTK